METFKYDLFLKFLWEIFLNCISGKTSNCTENFFFVSMGINFFFQWEARDKVYGYSVSLSVVYIPFFNRTFQNGIYFVSMELFPPVLNGSLMEIALSVASFLERLTKGCGYVHQSSYLS